MYLVYSYQYNKELLLKGLYRGHDEELLGHYRRECLLVRKHKPEHRYVILIHVLQEWRCLFMVFCEVN